MGGQNAVRREAKSTGPLRFMKFYFEAFFSPKYPKMLPRTAWRIRRPKVRPPKARITTARHVFHPLNCRARRYAVDLAFQVALLEESKAHHTVRVCMSLSKRCFKRHFQTKNTKKRILTAPAIILATRTRFGEMQNPPGRYDS